MICDPDVVREMIWQDLIEELGREPTDEEIDQRYDQLPDDKDDYYENEEK